jgi:hypothetical protein
MSTVSLVLDLEYQFNPVLAIEASLEVPEITADLTPKSLAATMSIQRLEVTLG